MCFSLSIFELLFIFIGLSKDLISCILIANDIYRYPLAEFRNENLEILNKAIMKKPCDQLIEVMDYLISSIPPLMKPGQLAL